MAPAENGLMHEPLRWDGERGHSRIIALDAFLPNSSAIMHARLIGPAHHMSCFASQILDSQICTRLIVIPSTYPFVVVIWDSSSKDHETHNSSSTSLAEQDRIHPALTCPLPFFSRLQFFFLSLLPLPFFFLVGFA